MSILAIPAVVLAFVSLSFVGIHLEKKDFNNGLCPYCGKPMEFFDTDSQGGRGYCCHDCDYHTWVSYNCVDKKYREVNP